MLGRRKTVFDEAGIVFDVRLPDPVDEQDVCKRTRNMLTRKQVINFILADFWYGVDGILAFSAPRWSGFRESWMTQIFRKVDPFILPER